MFLFKIHIWALLYFWKLYCRPASGFSHVAWYIICKYWWNSCAMLPMHITWSSITVVWSTKLNSTIFWKRNQDFLGELWSIRIMRHNMTESAIKPTIKSSKIQQCSYVYFEKKNQCPSPHAIILEHLTSSLQKKSVLNIFMFFFGDNTEMVAVKCTSEREM
jgi:hypothetical protein